MAGRANGVWCFNSSRRGKRKPVGDDNFASRFAGSVINRSCEGVRIDVSALIRA